MKICNKRQICEGINPGSFSGEREKILKEVNLDPDKMDGFMKASLGEDESMKAIIDLRKFTKKFSKMSGKSEELSVGGAKKEITLNTDLARKAIDRKIIKKDDSSLEMNDYMIPSNEGHVKHMCLTFGQIEGMEEHNYLEAMKTFISKMPSAKFTILTSGDADKEKIQNLVNQWAKDGVVSNPERVQICASKYNLTIWAQDSTLVVGNNVVEQDRMDFPSKGDSAVASELAKANPEVNYKRMEGIFIDGGNQLATDDTIFVGSDAVAFTIKDMKQYPSKYNKISGELKIDNAKSLSQEELVKTMMDRTFPHQKVVVIGYKGEQPAFHIDMAMTPLGKSDPETGKKVITVGDPSMALGILKDIKEKDPEKFASYEKSLSDKLGGWTKKPLEGLFEHLKDDKALQENFDAVAKGLEDSGYKIERVPYLGSSSLPYYPWITYNNSVVDGNNIFIPNFGIPELDNAGNSVYKKYGYDIVPLDMTGVSSLQGAINCITKVIERDYTESA
ncbi:MAG: hypothetical protein ABRQ39_30700 [Candidatus Eremiobacterota bacterium]